MAWSVYFKSGLCGLECYHFWFGEKTGQTCYFSFSEEGAGICGYCKLKEVMEENQNVHYQVEKPNGHHYEIVGAPIKLSDSRVTKLDGLLFYNHAAEQPRWFNA